MRPQSMIDLLNHPDAESLTVRCASGTEYQIGPWTSWYFDSIARTISLIVDGRTTIDLDPMLVESVQVRLRDSLDV
ncbi:MAG: hypothetical protein RL354_968 [Planctomycetota bacterium]|jgi:hypothetical protein